MFAGLKSAFHSVMSITQGRTKLSGYKRNVEGEEILTGWRAKTDSQAGIDERLAPGSQLLGDVAELLTSFCWQEIFPCPRKIVLVTERI